MQALIFTVPLNSRNNEKKKKKRVSLQKQNKMFKILFLIVFLCFSLCQNRVVRELLTQCVPKVLDHY